MQTKPNDKAPHQAVISIVVRCETCERLPNGQVSTKVVDKSKDSFIFTTIGKTLEDCRQQRDTLLNNLKERIDGKNQEKPSAPQTEED